ncbi:hypothetical protein C2857_002910 [Epichloe festucae Fl1]|uniref:Clr5 domain-containing protein n=1 Tax=Epichloe festucae (strain Fl1) TaxID=877507 RepID=A0A7S9KRX2_EPIFF|nr:hypothetical protein C2857_002910 [Epichloe festucae Fl1]
MSPLPLLAPKPARKQSVASLVTVNKEHTEEDWESYRDVIEHLYINENRRLVDTMAIMAAKHGFGATEQMYKKRLKKWNIRKRSYRKSSESPVVSTPPQDIWSGSPDEPVVETLCDEVDREQASVVVAPTMMRLAPYAGLELVLDSVRSWSLCKLEAPDVVADAMTRYLANPGQPPIQDSRTMYRTFELVFDLWHYGKGELAGMAARKAFYILEFVLTEDHPDLIWHILDTIYDMVDRGHIQLLGMFLKHAGVLATARLPLEHPLVAILQELFKCDYRTQPGREYVCHLLRSAWLRNVDILSDQVGSLASKHLWLYEQLIWDGRTRLRKGCELARKQGTMTAALYNIHLQQAMDSTVSGLDRLRIMALMLEYTQMDLENREKAEGLALELLRHTQHGTGESRSDARFHAYACKMLARLQEHRHDWAQAEGNLKHAIEKREAAHGTGSDLRVIRDMWVLAGHYQRAGRDSVANQIVQDAISRAETLLSNCIE